MEILLTQTTDAKSGIHLSELRMKPLEDDTGLFPPVVQSLLCCLLGLAVTVGTVSPHSTPTAFERKVDASQHHPLHCLLLSRRIPNSNENYGMQH